MNGISVRKQHYPEQGGDSEERRRFLARIELLSANGGASGRGRKMLDAGGARHRAGRPGATAAGGR